MDHNKSKLTIGKNKFKVRRGVAEVISTLLLVVITVVGAVILTGFIDQSFVAGSLSVTSGTDITLKKIKLIAYDTRNGDNLMDTNYSLNNTNTSISSKLCRVSCAANTTPDQGGTNFMILQIENTNTNPIGIKDIILENVVHHWDDHTVNKPFDSSAIDSSSGAYPSDGTFSILSSNSLDLVQKSNQIQGGETVNLLVKLDNVNDDIELSKTMRVQINIGENSLAAFLIETGDAR